MFYSISEDILINANHVYAVSLRKDSDGNYYVRFTLPSHDINVHEVGGVSFTSKRQALNAIGVFKAYVREVTNG